MCDARRELQVRQQAADADAPMRRVLRRLCTSCPCLKLETPSNELLLSIILTTLMRL